MKKRLSVFISSTYKDLKPERDAALRAVLEAGHIPAGMELFAAGNASQLVTIRRWIDTCDAYMLILGSRYGSLEPDSGTGYTELEYDYAQATGKAVFAIVLSGAALDTKLKTLGSDGTDEHGTKLKVFRERVLTRIAAIVDDTKDLRAETLKSLAEIAQREDVLGWMSGADVASLQNDLALLTAENSRLKNNAKGDLGVSTDGMIKILESESGFELASNLLVVLRLFGDRFVLGVKEITSDSTDAKLVQAASTLVMLNLVAFRESAFGRFSPSLTLARRQS